MKLSVFASILIIGLSNCISPNTLNADFILKNKLMYVCGNSQEEITMLKYIENLEGEVRIYVIDAECPKCLFPFIHSLGTNSLLKNDIFIFSVFQNIEFFRDLIIEETNGEIQFFLDKEYRFYNSIEDINASSKGIIKLKEGIKVFVNPDFYYN